MKKLSILIIMMLLSLASHAQYARLGDINRDNHVDVNDVMTLVDIILNGYSTFSVSPTEVTLPVGDSATVTIAGGYDYYEVVSANPDVVEASVVGLVVTLKAIAGGETTVTVKDVLTFRTIDIPVIVEYNALQLSTTELLLVVGMQGTVDITSGSGHYSVESSDEGIATATVSEGKVTVTAVSTGMAAITVTDTTSGQTTTIEVTVKDIYGDWISTQLDSRGKAYGSVPVTLVRVNKEMEGTVYNVLMKDFWMAGTEVYGIYDDGTITFPPQVIAQSTKALGYTDEHGRLELRGINAANEVVEDPMVLVMDEEGNFVLSEEWSAYYIYAEEYVNPDTGERGHGLDYCYELKLLPVNGSMSFFTTSSSFKLDPEQDGWAEGANDINYQDFETNVIINGFLGMGVISIDFNDDGTCTMQLKQTLGTDYYGEDYQYIRLIGVGEDPDRPGYIKIMEDKESSNGDIYRDMELNGGIKGDAIKFFDKDDEGHYTWNEYFYGASNPDIDGRWYTLGGFFCAMELDLYKNSPTGINELGMTREQKLKTTKTYNLMGQLVDRKAVKGILIRDGKKYIAK